MISMKIRAFNLIRGLVVNSSDTEDTDRVVLGVYRDAYDEMVTVVTQRHGAPVSNVRVHHLSFNDQVTVIGACVNPDDLDDTDFGTDA
jgi:hypothetical protein